MYTQSSGAVLHAAVLDTTVQLILHKTCPKFSWKILLLCWSIIEIAALCVIILAVFLIIEPSVPCSLTPSFKESKHVHRKRTRRNWCTSLVYIHWMPSCYLLKLLGCRWVLCAITLVLGYGVQIERFRFSAASWGYCNVVYSGQTFLDKLGNRNK